MRTFLQHDQASGELRLVMTDLWNGQHERYEFRVVNDDGTTVRRGQEFSGLEAYREYGSTWRTRRNSTAPWMTFTAEKHAVADTKTPCRRMASKSGRAKCSLCTN